MKSNKFKPFILVLRAGMKITQADEGLRAAGWIKKSEMDEVVSARANWQAEIERLKQENAELREQNDQYERQKAVARSARKVPPMNLA